MTGIGSTPCVRNTCHVHQLGRLKPSKIAINLGQLAASVREGGAEIVLFISVLAGFAALTWKLQKWMQALDVRQDTDVLFGNFRFDFALSSGGRRYIKRKMCEKLMTAKLIVNIWHRFLFTCLFSFNSFLFLCVSSYLLFVYIV